MSVDLGFLCSSCGEHHEELPMSYSTTAPDIWEPAHANDPDSVLSSDQCVIRNQAFFVRGLIELPVIGSTDVFAWGVWISLSRESFARASELWETPGRETERPYFGWLSTELSLYPESTTDLKTNVHTRPVGRRPRVELEPTEHPLAVEQRTGITPERVRQIAEAVLHPRR
ncbi:DUF2199 domain-containing protein [Streptomyces sp. H39-S7]|nr:DUF2199 domain-containing protein [Streptomyces sp. H39-S7]MCZ4121990.1 DUF2199 domain-containing protein [Streptomyces sp. H39-S7]